MSTIAAIATAPGAGGVGVIRISGPLAADIVCQLTHKEIPGPRKATLRSFYDADDRVIDHGLVIHFVSPLSYTGEEVVELQGHGGQLVLHMLLERVLELGAEQAGPGAFTERAFLNDRLDLAQAEAVADLIESQSQSAVRAANRSLQGQFSNDVQAIQHGLTQLRLWVEAAIDFPEEEIDFLADPELEKRAQLLFTQFDELQSKIYKGKLLRDGFQMVLVGAPNAGKSSLLNQLAGEESAIVTEVPGTTRDVLRETILMQGIPVHIADTAGLRQTEDVVEAEGIRRAKAEIEKADIVLLIEDVSDPVALPEDIDRPDALIFVHNKIDKTVQEAHVTEDQQCTHIYLSAKTGDGMDLLEQQILNHLGVAEQSQGSYSARQRHLDALQKARTSVAQGLTQLTEYGAGELMAEDLRQAQLALSEITGEFNSDDLLGEIFSSFCIGK
ncbi:MAG: tRNA uridine-5-carboxymethylaminomethyl(34) synthesis GTPase MnmE [bacterium]